MFRTRCIISSTFSKIHDYFVGDTIGNGFFSTIHAAFSSKTKNCFVIKFLHKEQIHRVQRGASILFCEKILAPLFDHPHIVFIQEVIESQQQIFQVMQYATNKDLLTYLRQAELDQDTAIKMMDQLLSSVEYLHSLGVCHRDIKLENILLHDNFLPKLSDFGLASIPFTNKLRNHCGSKGYVAPEAISSPEFDGYKADIWSLGVVFYIMFTRTMPFKEDDLDFESQINKLDFAKIPSDVKALIKSMWSKNPSDRPAAAQCRLSPIFSKLTNRPPSPEPAISRLMAPITPIDENIASHISQAMNMQISTFIERISEPNPRIEKLLYILLSRKLTKFNTPDNLFKMNFSHTSQPVGNSPQIQQLQFAVSSSDILEQINRFFLPRSACITSPLSPERSIVMNTTAGDATIQFELTDSLETKTCTLVLTADKRSSQLTKDFCDSLQKKFKTAS